MTINLYIYIRICNGNNNSNNCVHQLINLPNFNFTTPPASV